MSDDEFLVKLGKRIVKFRKKKGLKQKELAAKLGIKDNALGRIERGQVNTTINMLRKISIGLGASLSQLLDI